MATVTVVEDFDPDTLIHGPSRHKSSADDSDPNGVEQDERLFKPPKPLRDAPIGVKKVHAKTIAKTKPAKYQTNAARKAERSKQLKRKSEKADRGGGKPTRKGKGGRGKR